MTTKPSPSARTAPLAQATMAVPQSREDLLAEEPKIDAALKSFYSWWVPMQQQQQQQDGRATESSSSANWTPQLALACTRCLSKAINSHIMAISGGMTISQQRKNTTKRVGADAQQQQQQEDELQSLVERVWNEQAGTPGTKITKVLGRTALATAWKSASTAAAQQTKQDDGEVSDNEIKAEAQQQFRNDAKFGKDEDQLLLLNEFLSVFEELLLWQPNPSGDSRHGPDAILIFSTESGRQDELARRASQRVAVAQQRVVQEQERQRQLMAAALSMPPRQQQQSAGSLPHIEELTDNDQEPQPNEEAGTEAADVKNKP